MMIMAGCRLIYFVITGLIGALAVTVGIIALQATGKQKYLYIPEPHNDFIFSILAEELGFVGCVIVILLFAIFIWRGILIAIKSPDMFGSLLATGITTLIGIQVIINIGVVTSSIPNTGMPLPFFSYGGTALLILLSSCGILLNISRAGTKV